MEINSNENLVPPKLYGLFIETRNSFFLSIQSATSLEEAFAKARMEYEKLGRKEPMGEARINLFSIKTAEELNYPEIFVPSIDQFKNTEPERNVNEFTDEEINNLTKSFEDLAGDILPNILPNKKTRGPIKIQKVVRLKKDQAKKIIKQLEESPQDRKNRLMQEIIIKQDKKLFKQNLDNFSEAEQEYIKTRLK